MCFFVCSNLHSGRLGPVQTPLHSCAETTQESLTDSDGVLASNLIRGGRGKQFSMKKYAFRIQELCPNKKAVTNFSLLKQYLGKQIQSQGSVYSRWNRPVKGNLISWASITKKQQKMNLHWRNSFKQSCFSYIEGKKGATKRDNFCGVCF